MLLPDKKTRIVLGKYWPHCDMYIASDRPVPQSGTVNDIKTYAVYSLTGAQLMSKTGLSNGGSSADYLNLTNGLRILDNGPFTWMGWALTNDSSQNIVIQTYSPNTTTIPTFYFRVFYSSGTVKSRVTWRDSTNAWFDLLGNTAKQAGVWHHFAMTYESLSIKCFIDGAHDGTKVVNGTYDVADDWHRCGVWAGSSPASVDHLIRVRKALPERIIRATYESQRHLFGV